MSSCLRNALKMRSPERFPSSLQFTSSALSLGCQAFVVILINSNLWLLPFLPRLPSYSRPATGLDMPHPPSLHTLPLLQTPPSLSLVCSQGHPPPWCPATDLPQGLPGSQYGDHHPPALATAHLVSHIPALFPALGSETPGSVMPPGQERSRVTETGSRAWWEA